MHWRTARQSALEKVWGKTEESVSTPKYMLLKTLCRGPVCVLIKASRAIVMMRHGS